VRRLVPLVLPLAVVPVLLADGAGGASTSEPTATSTATATATPTPTVTPDAGPAERPSVRLRRTTKNTWVVRGRGERHGFSGRLVRYTVEVKGNVPGRARRAAELHEHVERAFGDEQRGWTARGERRLQRIGTPAAADVRIVLAPARWVDRACARGGMNTAGRFSCWTDRHGRYAALNLRRWRDGSEAPRFISLDEYRTYLINHEVGHGLDYGHRRCPRRGAVAPVMMPQSRVLYGCRPNGRPYP
jgi:hypothetical protein